MFSKKKNWTIHLYNLVFHGLIYISLKRQKGTSLSLSLSLSFPSLTVSFILALFFSSSSVYVLSPCLFVSPPLLATGPALQTSGIRQFRSVLSLACIGPKKTSSPPHLQYLVQFLETYWLTFLIAFFFPWIFQSLHLFHTLTFTCAFSFHPFSKFLPALVIKLFVVLLIFFFFIKYILGECRKDWAIDVRECQSSDGSSIAEGTYRAAGTGCQQSSKLVDDEPWRSRGMPFDIAIL